MSVASPPKIRLHHIAEKAGVSVATVSMALQNHAAINPATRQLVRRVARELGYRRLKGTAVVASGGKVIPHHFGFISCDRHAGDLDRANAVPMVQVLMRDALKIGVRIEMLNMPLDWTQPEVRMSVAQFVEGLDGVLLAGIVSNEAIEMLRSLGVPTVVIGYASIQPENSQYAHVHRVAYDGLEMGRLAARYLLSRGRQRVALMSCVSPRGYYFDHWERGYRVAHFEAGMPIHPELTIRYDMVRSAEAWADQFISLKNAADAIIWPDVEVVAETRRFIEASSRRVPRNDQVIGGQLHLLDRYGAKGTPAVVEDIASLARAAIERLRVLSQSPSVVGSVTYIPFLVRDLHFPRRR